MSSANSEMQGLWFCYIMKKEIIQLEAIRNKIYTIRRVPVMLDKDLAEFYIVKAIRLREQVKRNIKRFPLDFMFQLSEEEIDFMVSQNAIPSRKYLGGSRPFVFTEQGVAMLSAVLKSNAAINISIQIMTAFVQMRKYNAGKENDFERINKIELKQIEHDLKFDQIFSSLEHKSIKPKQGIFFDGQTFDAYKFLSDLIRSAKKSIIIIDNYIDESILTLLIKRQSKVTVTLYTKNITKQMDLDIKKYNQQYPSLYIKELKSSHDRFIIIDDEVIYHIGASLKDLGKKWFAFSKMDKAGLNILERLP